MKREEVFSLLEFVERRTRLYPTLSTGGLVSILYPTKSYGGVLAKPDQSSILRRWARLYPTKSDGGVLRSKTNRRSFDDGLVSSLKEKSGLVEARPLIDSSTLGSSFFDPVKERIS